VPSAALAAVLVDTTKAINRRASHNLPCPFFTGGEPDAALAAVLADAVVKNKTAADETGARRILPQLRELLQLYTQVSRCRHA
jgi:hypothetical protein